MSEAALSISNLNYSYEKSSGFALKNLSLKVPLGSCTLVLGPNGAGKSTLMSLLCGLIKKQSGDINITAQWPENFFSYGTQSPALYSDLTVKENLVLFARLMSHSTKALGKISEVTSSLDLTTHMNKKIAHCSGGLKQRAHIAATLLGDYPLLVLDEPFNNIDPESRLVISEALKRYCLENKATLLLSSHQFEAMEALWTHLAFLKNGEISDFICRKDVSDQKLQSLFFELKNAGDK